MKIVLFWNTNVYLLYKSHKNDAIKAILWSIIKICWVLFQIEIKWNYTINLSPN